MSRTGALRIAMTAAGLALGGATAQAQQVGTASAVNPAATANLKTITIGQSIAHKERIQTKASGSVQLLFLDKTSMTIGPNSDITIDEYVYDPSANTGKLAATLGKGALRFVGGQISHNGDAEIKTASALIGIRGGVMMTDGKGGIYSGYGTMTVNSGGQTVTLHAGEFTQTQAGGPPTLPGLPPPGFVQQLIVAFQSTAGQTGGARRGAASARNIASAEQKATGSSGGSVTGSNMPTPANPVAGLINAISSTFTQSVQTSSQETALQQLASRQPTPLDNVRPNVTISGYASGIDVIAYPGLSSQAAPFTGTSEIKLDATNNRVAGTLSTYVYDPLRPFMVALNAFSNVLFEFGSTGSSGPANSVYTNYNNFSATTASGATTHPTDSGQSIQGVPINGEIAVLNNDATKQIGVSSGVPDLTVCQCDYTRWGLWHVTNTTPNSPFTETIVGTWVAGRPVGSISDVPITGTATYTGHVIANVQSAGFVAGNFSNTVDFGARSGAVSVTNLDSTNYSGNVSFNTDPRNFGGTLAGNVGNRTMALQGSFFQGGTDPVGEMGGKVGIAGQNYLGSGIFAASVKH
ncbi:FecR domain-containing protein [Nitrobacter sp. NHB1]|uniref:FecR domain-containing protein n=1 Tax=Nitrobacter sp. NHB1 TaxID=3119830 RepID=UPI002FFF137A